MGKQTVVHLYSGIQSAVKRNEVSNIGHQENGLPNYVIVTQWKTLTNKMGIWELSVLSSHFFFRKSKTVLNNQFYLKI